MAEHLSLDQTRLLQLRLERPGPFQSALVRGTLGHARPTPRVHLADRAIVQRLSAKRVINIACLRPLVKFLKRRSQTPGEVGAGPRLALALSRPRSYPFTAPAVMPATKYWAKKEYRRATGTEPSKAPAINSPQKKTSPRIRSLLTPIGIVLIAEFCRNTRA